jgi:transposase-like protein/IS1 family transposase
MRCPTCQEDCKKFGKNRNGSQRWRCADCGKTYSEALEGSVEGFYLPMDQMVTICNLLVEGVSIRSIERITGTHRDTIMKVLVHAGEKCEKLMGRMIVNVPVKDVELDEIWGFLYKKEKRVKPEDDPNYGDAYTFVAIERNTKLVLNFALGKRNQATTDIFIEGLRHATSRKDFQTTTGGFGPYVSAITTTLSDRTSYARLIKVYGTSTVEDQRKYSPPSIVSTEVVPVMGNPDPARICTSIIERQNLTMRMQIRRLTRLTNGFSKKWENLWTALCLHFAHYNFCRIHRTIRVTPCIEANITDHVWTMAELLN